MRQCYRGLLVTVAAAVGFAGCAVMPKTAKEEMHQHTLRSDELRASMRDIDGIMLEQRQEFSELERENRKRRYALRLSDSLERMSTKVLALQKTAFSPELDDAEAERFAAFATQLREEGRAIGEMARTYRLEPLEASVERVKGICTACHKAFRAEGKVR